MDELSTFVMHGSPLCSVLNVLPTPVLGLWGRRGWENQRPLADRVGQRMVGQGTPEDGKEAGSETLHMKFKISCECRFVL